MNCRPWWTRNVTPTNSGTTVQSRDQVRIGSRLPVRWLRSTFWIKRSSTYGPFFSDRLIVTTPAGRRNYRSFAGLVQRPAPLFLDVVRARPASADDRRVGRLALLAGFAALGQHAGGAARVPTAGGAALAAAP